MSEEQTPDEQTPELTLDSSATATAEVEAPVEEQRPLAAPATPDAGGFIWGTGRRKSAVARVRVKPGDGKYLINGREIDVYLSEVRDRTDVVAPLKVTQTEGKLDVFVKVQGGGFTGQTGAIVLGLARALKGYDPTLEPNLREEGMLSRDPRRVERKKYGQPGARARFQFSKR